MSALGSAGAGAASLGGGNLGGAGPAPGVIPPQLGGQASGRSVSTSTSGTGIVPGMLDLYNQTLGLNQQNYGNILSTYGQAGANQQATLPGIYKGYGDLNQSVGNILGQGGNWGVATPAAQAIEASFAKTQGQTQQDMINRGLGNSSALSSASNQNTLLAGQAYGNLGAQLAQTYAGYDAQLGSANLAAQMQGLGMESQLAQAQGGTLGGQRYALPNVLGSYGASSSYGAGNLTNQYGQGAPPIRGNPGGGPGGGGFLPMEQGGGGGGSPYGHMWASNGGQGNIPGQISAASGQDAANALARGAGGNQNPLDYFPPGPMVSAMDDNPYADQTDFYGADVSSMGE